jgi:hypothetical protein
MKRAMRLTITLTSPDGNPGHPSRFTKTFKKIGEMLGQGARAGSFEEQFGYSVGGEQNYDNCTIDFDVMPTRVNQD